ncbi:MAG: DMT family transporter [Actinomycetota bacterium]
MAVLLSLITAAAYGAGDFCGGLATKTMRVVQVVAVSHVVGLIGVLVASPLLADAFTGRDFALGTAGGLFGGIGVALLYRRLSLGPMSVVAPLTAVTSAAVPAVWGVIDGDSLSAMSWVGIALALMAIALVSAVSDGRSAPVTPVVIVESLASGVGFGSFFIFLDATEGATAPWPVVGARLATSVLLVAYLLSRRQQILPAGTSSRLLLVAVGVLDTGSNITFLYATEEGALTVVAVLSSLYPIGTVLLARLVLDERMTRPQLVGFVAAMVATGFIAAG